MKREREREREREKKKEKEFPKIMGTILGVPIIRTIVFWRSYLGPPILGNYHFGLGS